MGPEEKIALDRGKERALLLPAFVTATSSALAPLVWLWDGALDIAPSRVLAAAAVLAVVGLVLVRLRTGRVFGVFLALLAPVFASLALVGSAAVLRVLTPTPGVAGETVRIAMAFGWWAFASLPLVCLLPWDRGRFDASMRQGLRVGVVSALLCSAPFPQVLPSTLLPLALRSFALLASVALSLWAAWRWRLLGKAAEASEKHIREATDAEREEASLLVLRAPFGPPALGALQRTQAAREEGAFRTAAHDVLLVLLPTDAKALRVSIERVAFAGVLATVACAVVGGRSVDYAHSDVSSRMVQLELGRTARYALRYDGRVLSWGQGLLGELGTGQQEQEAPTLVLGVQDVDVLFAGPHRVCARRRDERVFCWGAEVFGAAPTPTVVQTPTEVPALHGARSIALGDTHSCAVFSDGNVRCWGANEVGQCSGQLQNGGVVRTPTVVANVRNATMVAVGEAHSCAVTAEKRVLCWGGQRGAETARSPAVQPIDGVAGAVEVRALGATTCARTENHLFYCWGGRAPSLSTGTPGPVEVALQNVVHRVDGLRAESSGFRFFRMHSAGLCALRAGGASVSVCTPALQRTLEEHSRERADRLQGNLASLASNETEVCGLTRRGSFLCSRDQGTAPPPLAPLNSYRESWPQANK